MALQNMMDPPSGAAFDSEMLMPVGVEIEIVDSPLEGAEIAVDVETGEASSTEDVEEEDLLASAPFKANLADYMEEADLVELGTDLVELVKNDIESRRPWYDKMKKGLERLGVYDPESDAETGISKVSHPVLMEAATQFQARAMAELLPAGGPVKSHIVGTPTPEVREQAGRVERYMNYQLTIEDRTYYDERDQMLFLLPFSGSEFDKQYLDAATQTVVSRWVRCDDFVVPYNTKNLVEAARYTHDRGQAARAYGLGVLSRCGLG